MARLVLLLGFLAAASALVAPLPAPAMQSRLAVSRVAPAPMMAEPEGKSIVIGAAAAGGIIGVYLFHELSTVRDASETLPHAATRPPHRRRAARNDGSGSDPSAPRRTTPTPTPRPRHAVAFGTTNPIAAAAAAATATATAATAATAPPAARDPLPGRLYPPSPRLRRACCSPSLSPTVRLCRTNSVGRPPPSFSLAAGCPRPSPPRPSPRPSGPLPASAIAPSGVSPAFGLSPRLGLPPPIRLPPPSPRPGEISKSTGTVAAKAYSKTLELNEQYDLVPKAKTALDTASTAAANLDKNYGITAKIDDQLKISQAIDKATAKVRPRKSPLLASPLLASPLLASPLLASPRLSSTPSTHPCGFQPRAPRPY